jgi:hypothetical protein
MEYLNDFFSTVSSYYGDADDYPFAGYSSLFNHSLTLSPTKDLYSNQIIF